MRDSKIWDAQRTRKELWLSANGRFGTRSRLARNCSNGIFRMRSGLPRAFFLHCNLNNWQSR